MDKEKRYLKYEFSEEERNKMAREVTDTLNKIDGLEYSLKTATAQIKSDIAREEANCKGLGEKVRNGYEFRNIECEINKDFDLKIVTVYRTDTNEIVEERKMSPDECQPKLPLGTDD
jgi:hypothetical protein